MADFPTGITFNNEVPKIKSQIMRHPLKNLVDTTKWASMGLY